MVDGAIDIAEGGFGGVKTGYGVGNALGQHVPGPFPFLIDFNSNPRSVRIRPAHRIGRCRNELVGSWCLAA